jgi:hypothetical protein
MTVTPVVTNSYLSVDAKIERIRYPDPIPKISARLAASYLYDKHYSAQVEANQSDFGKVLRKMAYEDLNAVLAGAIRLFVPDANIYVGRRFYNHALGDVIDTRAEPAKKWIDPSGGT